jgi:hypothetical protein
MPFHWLEDFAALKMYMIMHTITQIDECSQASLELYD